MLGIKFIAPDSSAAKTVTKTQTAIAGAVVKGTERIGDFFAGLGADKGTGSDTTDLNTTDTDKTTTKTDSDTTKTDTDKTTTKTDSTKTDADKTTDKTSEPIDTSPAADKNTLIKAAADSNKNISKKSKRTRSCITGPDGTMRLRISPIPPILRTTYGGRLPRARRSSTISRS